MRTFQLKSRDWINLDQITFTTKNADGALTIHFTSGEHRIENDLNYVGLIEEILKNFEYEPGVVED
jgi:hypothetical protein